MRILILSNYPWKNNNSFGNTYSSIFGKVPDTEIAHIYMFDGKPDPVQNIKAYYKIPEREVFRSVFKLKRGCGVGKRIDVPTTIENEKTGFLKGNTSLYGKLLSFGKRSHLGLMFAARELAWKLGRVNYNDLMEFVEEFKPDIFFLPYSNVYYTNRIALYIKKHYDVPMVLEMAMDHYTLKRVSWNPFFWIDRFGKRKMIRRLTKQSELLFVISKKLKEELENALDVHCEILYKTPDKTRAFKPYMPDGKTTKFLFTGNISANRWKSLALLANEIRRQEFGHFDIYTATPISKSISKSLNIESYSVIHPPVSQSEVIDLQNNADILVHAESFDKYNKSLVRCAISTKIMDYLSVGRCILAIGPSDISSIEYLADNNVAIVADSKQKLAEQIKLIKENRNIIEEYAAKGREYVENKLDEDVIRTGFYNTLQHIIDNYRNN